MGTKSRKEKFRTLKDFTGSFLLASPELRDPNFIKTLIIIVEHGDEGAFGLILNRPLEVKLDNAAAALGLKWNKKITPPPIYFGGPVMGETIWMLHNLEEARTFSKEISPGLFFTSQETFLKSIIENPRGVYKFFVGYAGWASNQLENEIGMGTWLLPELQQYEMIFTEKNNIWDSVISSMGIEPASYFGGMGKTIH